MRLLPLALLLLACSGKSTTESGSATATATASGTGATTGTGTGATTGTGTGATTGTGTGATTGTGTGAATGTATGTGTGTGGTLPLGTACSQDNDCASNVCWDFADYDPFCFGAVCSVECTYDIDCENAFAAGGAPSPAGAICGSDNRCDPVGAGVGAFACAR